MTRFTVRISTPARRQLIALYDDIAERSGPRIALSYVERIEPACRALSRFPVRGTLRDDIRPGLRTMGFERRATIAFTIVGDRVVILAVLYGGRDVDARLRDLGP